MTFDNWTLAKTTQNESNRLEKEAVAFLTELNNLIFNKSFKVDYFTLVTFINWHAIEICFKISLTYL